MLGQRNDLGPLAVYALGTLIRTGCLRPCPGGIGLFGGAYETDHPSWSAGRWSAFHLLQPDRHSDRLERHRHGLAVSRRVG